MTRETEQRDELLIDLGAVAVETKGDSTVGQPDELAGRHPIMSLSDD